MNPFPGLRPFTQEEDYLFFGREEQTLELLQRLGTNRFVAVVGTSGSGKSSLVRCGLLSELLGGRMLDAGAAWEIAVTHPGGNPLALLTDALLEADLYDREGEHVRENLLATLSRSHFGLVEAVKQADVGEGTNFLLVVDQFEEIFRFQDAGQRQQEAANEFVSLLLEAAAQKEVPIYVVLTMRSDFIGECGQFEGLAEMVNKGEFLIPRLTREQYKRVIEGPIKVAGGKIAPRLLQRLLNDLGQQADQLPCLQHALMRTWNVWAGRGDAEALDLDDYQRVGKMSQALSLHADEIYDSLDSDRERELCQGIFQALTVEESNNRGIRRPQRLGRLCQILEVPPEKLTPIIDAYRQSGVTFLMPSPEVELTEQTIIDISHESLMRVWTRLRQWVEEETQAAGIYHRLSESADLHEQGKAGLYRDPELGIALAWQESKRPNAAWAERYRPGFSAAIGFLEASQRASVAEELAREASQQRELEQAQQLAEARQERLQQQQRASRRLRKLVAVAAGVAVIAAIACGFALVARQQANRLAEVAANEADRAVQNEQKAEQALVQVAAQKTEVERSLTRAESAESDAVEAEQRSREFRYATDMELAAKMIEEETANAGQVLNRLADHDPATNPAQAGKADLRGFEWHLLRKQIDARAAIIPGDAPVVDAAATSQGELVTLDVNGRVRRVDLQTRRDIRPVLDLRQDRTLGPSMALAPDGRHAALVFDNTVHLFDTTTGKEPVDPIPATAAFGMIFSPDSRMLVTVDAKIGWWAVDSGRPIAVVASKLNRSGPVSVSADGLTVAVGAQNGRYNAGNFSVFRLNREARDVTVLRDKQDASMGSTRATTISPDGEVVAVSQYFSGNVSLFNAASGTLLADSNFNHAASVSSIRFNPQGTQMVTGSLDGSVKVWPNAREGGSTAAAGQATALMGHTEPVILASLTPGGTQVLSTSADRTTRVWEIDRSSSSLHQTVEDLQTLQAVCSPTGLFFAAVEYDAIRLRDMTSGAPLRAFAAPVDPVQIPTEGIRYSVALSPDRRHLAVGYGGKPNVSYIELWDIDRGKRLAVLPGSTDIPNFNTTPSNGIPSALAFSPDGKTLAAGFGVRTQLVQARIGSHPIKLYDVPSRQAIRLLRGHESYCVSVTFSADGTRLAGGSYDGTARIWDPASGRTLHVLQNPDPVTEMGNRRVLDVAFAPNGERLAMASMEGNVHIWSALTGTHLETLRGHANGVRSVAFSPDGNTLASGSQDKTVRLWNTSTWREVMRLEPAAEFQPFSLAFSPDGRQLLGAGGKVVLWSTSTAGLRPTEELRDQLAGWLSGDFDFVRWVRMLGDAPNLEPALELLKEAHPDDDRVRQALVAARTHRHLARNEQHEAILALDELGEITSGRAEVWFRTPILLRLAKALLETNRPRDAAQLLTGGAPLRNDDGLAPALDESGVGVQLAFEEGAVRVKKLFARGPAERSGLRAGDTVVRVGELEITPDTFSKLTKLLQGSPGTTVKFTVRHTDGGEIEVVELKREQFIQDPVTADLLHPLKELITERLASSPLDPALLELRGELAGQWSGAKSQVADYTAAIEALSRENAVDHAAGLQRLYGRRGHALTALKQWSQAVDDFARSVTDVTTDEVLLTNQALARAQSILEPAWSVVEPTELRAQKGASLTRQEDGSILASGPNQEGEVYTIATTSPLERFNAVRLEVLPDSSLPGKGPGRHETGAFHLRGFRLYESPGEGPLELRPVSVASAWASYSHQASDVDIAGTINPALNKFWHVWGRLGQSHEAVFRLQEPVVGKNRKIAIELRQGHPLGRFRLSVCDDPLSGNSPSEDQRLAAHRLVDPWLKLAAASRLMKDWKSIEALVEQHPDKAGAVGELFTQGKDEERDWPRATEIYDRGITADPANPDLLSKRARAAEGLGQWDVAAAAWAEAAALSPEGPMWLAGFARRLAGVGKNVQARAQFQAAEALFAEALERDPGNDVVVGSLARMLSGNPLLGEPDWAPLTPMDPVTVSGTTVTVENDQSIILSAPASTGPERIQWRPGPKPIRALRIETCSRPASAAGAPPSLNEYQVVSVDMAAANPGAFRGQFIRLDLPGDNSQFPRHASDVDKKVINLAELQVFQGDQNIALKRPARLSTDFEKNRLPADRAVDGNTTGNDTTNSYAHSQWEDNPWWEVDLEREQTFDRIVVWNRSDTGLQNRLNHFRIRVLDASRRVVFERLVDKAPSVSLEMACPRFLSEPMARDAATNQPFFLDLPVIATNGSAQRFRVSAASTLADLLFDERREQALKIADPIPRLATAYALNGRPAESLKQIEIALAQADGFAEGQRVLEFAAIHDDLLEMLVENHPDDLQIQLAAARNLAARGARLFRMRQLGEARADLEKSRAVYSRLSAAVEDWTVLEPAEMRTTSGAALRLESDRSVFADREPPAPDETLTLEFDSQLPRIAGLRLEVLPDPRLPAGGPGWGENGNFLLNELSLATAGEAGSGKLRSLALRNPWADFSQTSDGTWDVASVIDGNSGTGWAIGPQTNKSHAAVFELAEPLESATVEGAARRLTFQLRHKDIPLDQQSIAGQQRNLGRLGRFRLSLTGDRGTLIATKIQADLTDKEVTDLNIALGKVLFEQGLQNEAAQAWRVALDQAPAGEERTRVLDALMAQPGMLSTVARLRPQDLSVQTALAKQHADQAAQLLEKQNRDAAIAELEMARKIGETIRSACPEPVWTVLEPVSTVSKSGAPLRVQSDRSVLAGGEAPLRDVYTLTFRNLPSTIRGLRLEVLPDDSLPEGGTGRAENGSFVLTEITASLKRAGTSSDQELSFKEAAATYSQPGFLISAAIDRNRTSPHEGWGISPKQGQPHSAVFDLGAETVAGPGSTLTVSLAQNFGRDGMRSLIGRCRLSVTRDPDAAESLSRRQELTAGPLADLETTLAKARQESGAIDAAVAGFDRAIDQAPDRVTVETILKGVTPGVREQLLASRPEDPRFHDALFRDAISRGESIAAHTAAMRARELYEKRLATHPDDLPVARALADLLLDDSQGEWTVLEPIEMKSTGGATLSKLEDNSILASGTNPLGDKYTIIVQGAATRFRAIRLEALTHPSLPGQGPGRDEAKDRGNFDMTHWTITAVEEESAGKSIPLSRAAADFSNEHAPVSVTRWNVGGNGSRPHSAVFEVERPIELDGRARLQFELQFSASTDWPRQNLGRFRLSASAEEQAFERAEMRFEALKLTSTRARLGAAYALAGDMPRAVATFERALDLAPDDQARAQVGRAAAWWPEVFAALAEKSAAPSPLTLGESQLHVLRQMVAKQFRDAEQIAAQALRSCPDDLTLLTARAEALHRQRLWTDAVVADTDLIERQTDAEKRRLIAQRRAEARMRMGQSRQAADELTELMFLNSSWEGPRDAAAAQLAAGDLAAARAAATRLSNAIPANSTDGYWSKVLASQFIAIPGMVTDGNLTRLLNAAKNAGGEWNESLTAALRYRRGDLVGASPLLNDRSGLPHFQSLAAMLQYDRKQTTQARQLLQQADAWFWRHRERNRVAMVPATQSWQEWTLGRGVWREAVRKLNGPALADLDARLKQAPDDREARLKRAHVLSAIGLDEEALVDLQRLDQSAEKSAELIGLRGRIQAGLLQYDAALIDLDQAIEAGTADPLVYAARAAISSARGQTGQARQDLEKSLSIEPTNLASRLLADLLLAESAPWTILQPEAAASEQGVSLSVLPDGSILASGKAAVVDRYEIHARAPGRQIAAVRLEALSDSMLENDGPGRGGNFVVSELEVSQQQADGMWRPLEWDAAVATYEQMGYPAGRAVDGRIDSGGWAIWGPDGGGTGRDQSLVARLKSPMTTGEAPLRIVIHQNYGDTHTLGRFRLSFTEDTAALDRERQRVAAEAVVDPRLKLAAAYEIRGMKDEALRVITAAFDRAENAEARRPVVEFATRFDRLLSALFRAHPEEGQLQLAMARRLAQRGRQRLADDRLADAAADLKQSRELFARLPRAAPQWTVLTPSVMTAASGAKLTLEPDGSVFVSGNLQGWETLALEFDQAPTEIGAIRLEALRDDRLPSGGPGTHSSGNFVLSDFTVFSSTADEPATFTPESLRTVYASFQERPAALSLTKGEEGWSVHGATGKSHYAVFAIDREPTGKKIQRLRVVLDFSHSVAALLGRFRIAVSSESSQNIESANHMALTPGEAADVSAAFATAQARAGQTKQALASFIEAVDLAADADLAAQSRIIDAAAPWPELLDALARHARENPRFQAQLFRHFAGIGATAQAETARRLALSGYEKMMESEPDSSLWADELADLLLSSTGLWTIVRPDEMTSTGGATLTLLEDGSILASGTNPDRDNYVLVARPALSKITAIRLEAIPDPSLPQNGPGRDSGGNFHLNELRVTSAGKPCVLREIAVSYSESDEYRWIIDGKNDESRGWGTYTRSGQQHVAVIATQVSRSPTDDLRFEFNFSRAQWTQHALGRFRLLVSDDPSLIGRSAQALQPLTSPGASDPWNKLAFAYHQAGDQAGLDRLLQRRPQAVIGLGNQLADLKNWTAAAAVWSRVLTPDSKDVEALARRANAYEKLSLWDKAAADWGRVHELVSDKTQRFDNRFAIIRRAEAYDRLRLFDKALADYNSALELPNAGIDPLIWRKDHWAQRARWSDAAADFRQLWSRRDPAWFIEWWYPRERAFLNLISGDFDGYRQAVAELLTRTEKLTDPDSARYVGYVLMVAPGMIDASNRERLTSAIERDDAWGQPRLKAAIHFRCGEFQQAADLFDQNPGGIEFELLAAMTHARLQNTDRAWQLFRRASRALQQHRDNDPGCGENVPRSQWWGIWAMQLQLQQEAARVLDGQALTNLDASLIARPRDESLRLKRARRLADLGLPDEALADLRAIPPSASPSLELVELRGRLLATLGLDDAALVDLNQAIEAGTEDANVYGARGQILRDRGSREQARTDLETSLKIEATPAAAGALAEMILKTEVPGWTQLTPTELKSAGGATLTPLGNGAILSSGMHPNRDDYTLTFAGDLKNITAISLEILPLESLGGYGGRGTGGGFILSEFDVSLRDEAGGQMPVVLNEVVADYEGTEVWAMSRYVIDGQNDDKGWGTPNNAIPHRLIVKPESPVIGNSKILRIVLRQNHFNDAHKLGLLLGCFRLSASNHPAAFDQEQRRFAALKITDPYIKLTAAYVWSGDAERAADWLRLTHGKHELSALLESGCLTDEVVDSLHARHPDSCAALLPRLALSAGERGKFELARNLYERLVTLQPENELWKERADQFRTGTIAVWNFETEPAPWGSISDCQLVVQNGVLTARTAGGDPHMVASASGPAGGKAVVLRYRTDEPFTMDVYWGDSTGGADESRKKQYLIPASPGEWREITLSFWCQGTLNALRLDPNTVKEHPLEIDSIVVRQVEPSEAWNQAPDGPTRTSILEAVSRNDDLVLSLVEQFPDASQWQLALGRNLTARGQQALTNGQTDQALSLLHQAQQAYAQVSSPTQWTVLTPTELKSAGGETFTVENDGSVFVSGPNPDRAVYTLKLKPELPAVTSIRLETIPDPRLPQGRAGRAPENGNFHVSELTVASVSGDAKESSTPIVISAVIVDNEQSASARNMLDGNSQTRWDTYPNRGPHWAVFGLTTPVEIDGGSLSITLDSGITEWVKHGLGRFRLLVTGETDALTRTAILTILKPNEISDASVALASAQARQDQKKEALASFTQAIDLATDHAGQARVIAAAAPLPGMLDVLAKRGAGNGQFQAELARHFAEQGEPTKANAARSVARQLFEQQLAKEPENSALALELAEVLQPDKTHWTVLKPTEMRSDSGATLTRLADDSILVSGLDPDQDSYTMTAAAGLPNITTLRLEAIPDPSLPGSGPGRAPNFVLTDIQVSGSAQAVQFAQAIATYEQRTAEAFYPAANAIDQDPLTGWAVHPRVGQSHSAFFQLKNPLTLDAQAPLVIVLHFKSTYAKHVLGRFRLSVSDDPAAFDRERKQIGLLQPADPWEKLALAYHAIDDQPALDQLLERHPAAAVGIGDLHVEDQNWERAIALYGKVITDATTDVPLLAKRAATHIGAGNWDLAQADWQRIVAQQPDQTQAAFDVFQKAERWNEAAEFGLQLVQRKRENISEETLVWLRVAPVLALADDPEVYASFCDRMARHFAESDLPEVPDRIIKAALLRPDSIDLAKLPGDRLAKILDDGTGPDWFPSWGWCTRALWAYRAGDDASAVKFVSKSEEHKPPEVAHTLNLNILALAQIRLERLDAARQTLKLAQDAIQKLEADPSKRDHDLLIAQILLREAESLIQP